MSTPLSYRTGCLALDTALGGGLPGGIPVEIYGDEASGKTSIVLSTLAVNPGIHVYADAERSLSPHIVGRLDLQHVMFHRPKTGESCFEFLHEVLFQPPMRIAVIDSTIALLSQFETDLLQMGKRSHAGIMGRMLAKGIRPLLLPVHQNQRLLLTVNQLRFKPKQGSTTEFDETTPGGKFLKVVHPIRIRIFQPLPFGQPSYGLSSRFEITRHPNAAIRGHTGHIDLLYGYGITNLLHPLRQRSILTPTTTREELSAPAQLPMGYQF